MLKTHTKEVLYEKYRTEKLLARRATRQITDDERQRLLEGASFVLKYTSDSLTLVCRSRVVIY